MTTRHTEQKNQQLGSALLLTLLVVSLLMVLTLSFTVHVRMELRKTLNAQHEHAARSHARLGMALAINALQTGAGPDRRATAPADLEYAAPVHPHWTGIYGNRSPADYTQRPDLLSPITRQHLQWLVSGNEQVGILTDPSGTLQDVSPLPTFRPDSMLTVDGGGTYAESTALSSLRIGGTPARLLVGPNTVDAAHAGSDFVAAPLVEIPASSLVASAGAYAWWVGDESRKAKVNMRPSYQRQESAAEAADFQTYSFLTAQRFGVDMMDYAENTLLAGFNPSGENLDRLAGFPQLRLLEDPRLHTASIRRFHDLTVQGHGVIADAFAGGLKKDLTSDAANPSTLGEGARPGDTEPLFPPIHPSDRVPTWGMLRAFPRTNASGGILPVPPTGQNPGTSPVINFASLGYDMYLDGANRIQVALFPVVVLWNPYNAVLQNTEYEIGFRVHQTGASLPRIDIQTRANPASPFSTRAYLNLHTGQLEAGAPGSAGGYLRFRIQATEMSPGETQIYALESTGAYSAGTNVLTLGYDGGKFNNYANLSHPSLVVNDPSTLSDGEMRALTPRPGHFPFDVVLAETGSISTPDDNGGWHQSIRDARMGWRGVPIDSNIIAKHEAPLATFPPFSSGTASVMFISMPMETRGGFNSQAHFIGALGNGRTRWLVTGNPRANQISNTAAENNHTNRGNILYGANLLGDGEASSGRYNLFPYIGRTAAHRVGIGPSQDTSPQTWQPAVLFDLLRSPNHFLSLGQLQHAHLSRNGFEASYSFGNAWASVRMPRDTHFQINTVDPRGRNNYIQPEYDLSWHLNRALWDQTFVSGVPAFWTEQDLTSGRPLPNGRITYYKRNGSAPNLSDIRYEPGSPAFDSAAANLLIDGAFNVNSTSEQAWRAFLSATLGLPHDNAYADAGDVVSSILPIPRFTGNLSQPGFPNTMGATGRYHGNRGLFLRGAAGIAPVEDLVRELARRIVTEIKARGPFLSVSQFVNRSLDPDSADGIRGALQAAIDRMPATAAANPRLWTDEGAPIPRDVNERPYPHNMIVSVWDLEHYLGAPAGESTSANSTRFASAPKYLTQADLLSLLGPALTVRGDTFLIRTYGEVRLANGTDILARAWGEAVVQRIPDYLDPADAPETPPASLTSSENTLFGRRFVILSFRWLSPEEI